MNTKYFTGTAFALLLFALLTLGAYFPGLGGVFLFDDQPNITGNSAIQIESLTLNGLYQASISYGGSILTRPISMLSLALNHYFIGLDPFYYKLTNLVVHLLCGFAVFFASRQLLRAYGTRVASPLEAPFAYWLSVAVTSVWLLHPINLTSVLYVVQRMNSLSALFVFSGIGLYCWGRLRLLKGKGGLQAVICSVFLVTPLAFLCKENGLLLPVYLLLVEWLFFKFIRGPEQPRWLITGTFVVSVAIPAMALLVFLAVNPDWLANLYEKRLFTLEERLLTQPRVLLFYLKLLLVPSLSNFGLYHDDIALSVSLTSPWSTLWAVLAIVAAVALAIWWRNTQPIAAFGIFFYLGSHLMESTFLPLEMAHEHRNYVGAFGVLFALLGGLSLLLHSKLARVLPMLAGIIVLLLMSLTFMRAAAWGNIVDQASLAVRNHPDSARSHAQLGKVYWGLMLADDSQSEKYAGLAYNEFVTAAKLDSYHSAGNLAVALRLVSDVEVSGLSNNINLVARQLLDALNGGAISAFSVMSVVRLGDCVSSGSCRLAPDVMTAVFEAALQNEALINKQRGRVLASAANVAYNRGDLEAALQAAERALEYEPGHLQHYLNLSQLSLAAGDTERARQLLAVARRKDTSGTYAEKISYQESLISAINRRDQQTDKVDVQ